VRALLPSFVAKRDEVLTEKIVFEKFDAKNNEKQHFWTEHITPY
tara:strand:+ start:159 stop:290 length:132 start_codon:yes stop_codon:yes gene_type:complete